MLGGLRFACAVPAIALAQSPPVDPPTARVYYDAHIAEAAKRFHLPPSWIRVVLGAESAGDRRAISSKGAMGLMQIMPKTWLELRARYRLGSDPYDPHDNIIAGSAYIRELLDRYGSPGWIAAYNAGPARYEASLHGRRLPRETRAYVAAVASAIRSGNAAKAIVPTSSAPSGWRNAPVFAAQPNGKPAAFWTQGGAPHDAARNAAAADDSLTIAPRSGGLFISRTGDTSAP
ncbi:lytic transglycosylase domain-containing protein [Mesorhizobium sp. M0006]|uniref:lytic transglycosylase domain-containing protein n=1 Tax=Mesorhizobium sp. M0006 TaxID=2956838 RepID=UPI003337A660